MLDVFSGSTRGSGCTIHARSARGAVRRFEQYGLASNPPVPVEAINYGLAEAAPIIVHLAGDESRSGRLRRYCTSIVEVTGLDDGRVSTTELWGLDAAGDARAATRPVVGAPRAAGPGGVGLERAAAGCRVPSSNGEAALTGARRRRCSAGSPGSACSSPLRRGRRRRRHASRTPTDWRPCSLRPLAAADRRWRASAWSSPAGSSPALAGAVGGLAAARALANRRGHARRSSRPGSRRWRRGASSSATCCRLSTASSARSRRRRGRAPSRSARRSNAWPTRLLAPEPGRPRSAQFAAEVDDPSGDLVASVLLLAMSRSSRTSELLSELAGDDP